MNKQSDKAEENHIICDVRSKPADRQKVKKLLLELVGPARAEEGCLYYDVYQQGEEADAFYIIDGWASEEAVAARTVPPNVPRLTSCSLCLPLL